MKNDKSIECFMKELDQLETTGELDDNEPAFHGHTLDLTKWEAYQYIKSAMEGLLNTSQHMATNSAFKTGRTAIRAPYFFHMAHDYRHGKIKVVCGIKDKQEYRFIFDADDLTKPPQNKEKSLPDNEVCQCLECFREFSKAVHKTKEPGRENLLAKSINRQMEHMRHGVHTLPDELEDISEMPHESFREYAEGVLENMAIA